MLVPLQDQGLGRIKWLLWQTFIELNNFTDKKERSRALMVKFHKTFFGSTHFSKRCYRFAWGDILYPASRRYIFWVRNFLQKRLILVLLFDLLIKTLGHTKGSHADWVWHARVPQQKYLWIAGNTVFQNLCSQAMDQSAGPASSQVPPGCASLEFLILRLALHAQLGCSLHRG